MRPARMQDVQTRTRLRTPSTKARTRCRLGFQRRRRVLFAWLITLPYCGPLPQISHFMAINDSSSKLDKAAQRRQFNRLSECPHPICPLWIGKASRRRRRLTCTSDPAWSFLTSLSSWPILGSLKVDAVHAVLPRRSAAWRYQGTLPLIGDEIFAAAEADAATFPFRELSHDI
jgi:hypothetical protein